MEISNRSNFTKKSAGNGSIIQRIQACLPRHHHKALSVNDGRKRVKIDVQFLDELNEDVINKGDRMEDLVTKLTALVAAAQEAEAAAQAVTPSADATADTTLIAAVVAALEARGYTVTAPVA